MSCHFYRLVELVFGTTFYFTAVRRTFGELTATACLPYDLPLCWAGHFRYR